MLADTEIDEEHGFKVIHLSKLKLVFLPANTTSIVQPLDQGIIACAKAHYRQQLVQWVIAEALQLAEKPENAGKSLKELRPNFYQMISSMRWLSTAWKECGPPQSLCNCWHKAGIVPEGWIAGAPATEDAGKAFQQLDAAMHGLQVVCKHVAHSCHTTMS
jgi:hypothetical protein